ncbi:FAD-dependent oxidoreductase [Reinekea marinisedimentorum]|uniref:Glycine oxidase n=1 Tax=Reinekea marinisedimentorum TaxID=230495 RepID=A0A4R3I530_9GAMM|nr:FAD-dependent oxidoreductase [Reinekea marinisedimentorum]TCS41062.1 glycine oxidase [Reinekea marinisedimentorum]
MKVAIIGAGVLGRITALELIGRNHEVTLLEAKSFDQPHGAAVISAGMIAPAIDALDKDDQARRMAFHSERRWPHLLDLLQQLDPKHSDVFFRQSGALAIAFPDEMPCLFEFRHQLERAYSNNKEEYETLYNDEVTELEPDLIRFETALLLKHESNICNRQFVEASTRALRKHANIVDYWPLKGRGDELKKQYDWILDCRGAGAVKSSSYAELENNHLRSVRSEAIRVKAPKVNFTRPIHIIQPRFHVYVVPKPDNIYVVGATDSHNLKARAVTVQSSLESLSTLNSIHAGFAEAEIMEAFAASRAIYEDNSPVITQKENIITANGLSRHGWLLGPALAEQLANFVV